MAHDFLGDVADHQALNAGASVGRQNNQIGEKIFGAIEDVFERIALANVIVDFGDTFDFVAAELLKQNLGVFFGGTDDLSALARLGGIGVEQRRIGRRNLRHIELVEGIMDNVHDILHRAVTVSQLSCQTQRLQRKFG